MNTNKSINSRRGGGGNAETSPISWWKILFLASLVLLVSFLIRLNYQLASRLGQQPSTSASASSASALSPSWSEVGVISVGVGDAPVENDSGVARKRLNALRKEVSSMKENVGHLKEVVKELKAENNIDAESISSNKNNLLNAGGELRRMTCTPDVARKQADRMNKRFNEWWSHSACPDQVWMSAIHRTFDMAVETSASSSQSQPYLVLDIGCNKGYTSADFFDALSPGNNFNPSTLVDAIRAIARKMNTKFDRDGGVCNDSNKPLNKDDPFGTKRQVEVHCFEPSPATFNMLENAREILGLDATGTGHGNGDLSKPGWHIHNAGLHEVNGQMSWHSACASAVGDELCTIVPDGTEGAIQIPVWTVDKFLEGRHSMQSPSQQRQPPIVHMLKIDAEGLDPAVLTGSTQLLTQNRAIMVMFEFNPGLSEKDPPHGMWGRRGNPHRSLLEVTRWLDTLGYDCYLDTRLVDEREKAKGVPDAPALYRITGDCLTEEPRVRGWANVVCASRKFGSAALLLRNLATMV